MKKHLLQPGLVIVALSVFGLGTYLIPRALGLFSNMPYQLVFLFLAVVIMSNVLAKIVHKYISS